MSYITDYTFLTPQIFDDEGGYGTLPLGEMPVFDWLFDNVKCSDFDHELIYDDIEDYGVFILTYRLTFKRQSDLLKFQLAWS